MKNSPEYTALIKSLKEYTKEKDIDKDEKNLKAVKEACVNYLDHYKQKKDKSEFAKMRGEKVKELLDSLGGAPEKTDKRTGTLTNAKELEDAGAILIGKTTLDELAKELCKEEKDNMAILAKIGEIRGLLLDIFT